MDGFLVVGTRADISFCFLSFLFIALIRRRLGILKFVEE